MTNTQWEKLKDLIPVLKLIMSKAHGRCSLVGEIICIAREEWEDAEFGYTLVLA